MDIYLFLSINLIGIQVAIDINNVNSNIILLLLYNMMNFKRYRLVIDRYIVLDLNAGGF